MPKNNIIPQMFDIRPVNDTGDLDWEKIKKVERELGAEVEKIRNEISGKNRLKTENFERQKDKPSEYFSKIISPLNLD